MKTKIQVNRRAGQHEILTWGVGSRDLGVGGGSYKGGAGEERKAGGVGMAKPYGGTVEGGVGSTNRT